MCGGTGLTIYTALIKAIQEVVLSIAEHALSKGGVWEHALQENF